MLRGTIWTILATISTVSLPAVAQTPDRGMLLVATDSLDGTMFEETLILVVNHSDEGSIGIMINRPTRLQPVTVFPDIAGAESYTGVLYFGGPLAPSRPFLLARQSEPRPETGIRIVEDVYLSGDASVLGSFGESRQSASVVRIYAGSTQWAPQQLQREINAGAWELIPATARMIFAAEPETLWMQVMAAPRGTETANRAPQPQTAADLDLQLAAQ